MTYLTCYLLVSSAENFCKQFGPRSGLTNCRAWSGPKLFLTLIVFRKLFFEKVDFEKKSADDKIKSMQNYLVGNELNIQSTNNLYCVNLYEKIHQNAKG